MIQAVGSTQSPAPLSSTGSAGALQAQLVQVENQLAACVDCQSASTPEGKAKIQTLSDRAAALRQRMQDIQNARQAQQAAKNNPSQAGGTSSIPMTRPMAAGAGIGGTAGVQASGPAGTPGQRLDVTT